RPARYCAAASSLPGGFTVLMRIRSASHPTASSEILARSGPGGCWAPAGLALAAPSSAPSRRKQPRRHLIRHTSRLSLVRKPVVPQTLHTTMVARALESGAARGRATSNHLNGDAFRGSMKPGEGNMRCTVFRALLIGVLIATLIVPASESSALAQAPSPQ